MDIEELAVEASVLNSRSRFETCINILNTITAKTVAELGVWKGDFARKILENCNDIEKYFMIDPWANLPDWNKPFNVDSNTFENVYNEAMNKTSFAAGKRIVLRGRTKEVIEKIPNESLDFAYIDGDHTLRGITIDLVKLLPKIKENGFICGDDFVPNIWQHDTAFEPTLVYPFSVYFAEAMDLPIMAMPHNQFLIQKKSNASFSFYDQTNIYNDLTVKGLFQINGMKMPLTTKIKSLLRKIGLTI